MKQVRTVVITSLVVLFIIGIGLFLVGHFQPQEAGLYVETTPRASVFINSFQVGSTPYKIIRKPEEIVLKVVPEDANMAPAAFETKLTLIDGIETIVRRDFGQSDEVSAGEIVSFEKGTAGETSLVTVSIPDNAQVSIDGSVRGFAPYKTTTITPGQHQVSLQAPGYKQRDISVKTIAGYKLTAVVKLARGQEGEDLPALTQLGPSPSPEPRVYVEVLQTPSGFLRVRELATTNSKEIGRTKTGDRLPLLDDSVKGWFRVEFDDPAASTDSGWISSQYSAISQQ